jgi:hypothetical protein
MICEVDSRGGAALVWSTTSAGYSETWFVEPRAAVAPDVAGPCDGTNVGRRVERIVAGQRNRLRLRVRYAAGAARLPRCAR